MRSILVSLLTASALCACDAGGARQPTAPGSSPTAQEELDVSQRRPVPPDGPHTEGANASRCGAGELGCWLNVLPTETVKAEIAQAVGQRPIRYYNQGEPITLDFNPARLNVELGADGRIKLFRCG